MIKRRIGLPLVLNFVSFDSHLATPNNIQNTYPLMDYFPRISNIDVTRYGVNSVVDERAMMEIYLPPFEAAVSAGQNYLS